MSIKEVQITHKNLFNEIIFSGATSILVSANESERQYALHHYLNKCRHLKNIFIQHNLLPESFDDLNLEDIANNIQKKEINRLKTCLKSDGKDTFKLSSLSDYTRDLTEQFNQKLKTTFIYTEPKPATQQKIKTTDSMMKLAFQQKYHRIFNEMILAGSYYYCNRPTAPNDGATRSARIHYINRYTKLKAAYVEHIEASNSSPDYKKECEAILSNLAAESSSSPDNCTLELTKLFNQELYTSFAYQPPSFLQQFFLTTSIDVFTRSAGIAFMTAGLVSIICSSCILTGILASISSPALGLAMIAGIVSLAIGFGLICSGLPHTEGDEMADNFKSPMGLFS